jgi:hypothetical protein
LKRSRGKRGGEEREEGGRGGCSVGAAAAARRRALPERRRRGNFLGARCPLQHSRTHRTFTRAHILAKPRFPLSRPSLISSSPKRQGGARAEARHFSTAAFPTSLTSLPRPPAAPLPLFSCCDPLAEARRGPACLSWRPSASGRPLFRRAERERKGACFVSLFPLSRSFTRARPGQAPSLSLGRQALGPRAREVGVREPSVSRPGPTRARPSSELSKS